MHIDGGGERGVGVADAIVADSEENGDERQRDRPNHLNIAKHPFGYPFTHPMDTTLMKQSIEQ